ncbi:MAG: luciferase family protein [Pseudomonadota bacterium]
MADLRQDLEQRLSELPNIDVGRWKDTDLVCVFFKGRDFAHFHNNHVLDIRLSQKIIREEQLPRTIASTSHPNRSRNSRWIEVEFLDTDDVDRVIRLVERACHELM